MFWNIWNTNISINIICYSYSRLYQSYNAFKPNNTYIWRFKRLHKHQVFCSECIITCTCIIFSWTAVTGESEMLWRFCHPSEVQYKLIRENKRPGTTIFPNLRVVSNTAYTYGVAPGAYYIPIKQAHHSCKVFLQYAPVKPPSLLFLSNF